MGAAGDISHINHEPSPDHPGWWTWDLADGERFNNAIGPLLVRPPDHEGGPARLRMVPRTKHSNLGEVAHGGATLTLIDIAMFACSRMLGVDHGMNAVTVDLSTKFTGPGLLDKPMIAEVELVRETRRLAFLRGIVTQDEGAHVVASFSGILKKGRGAK